MENLAHLQNWLRWIITHPHGVDQALTSATDQVANGNSKGREPLPRALEQIADLPPLARTARLDIYAEGYYSRILEVLATDYEHLARVSVAVAGENAFRKMVSDFLRAHPSETKSIAEIGRHLPQFLKTYAPFRAFPYLAEIGAMDWSATHALYVDSLPAFDPASLALIPEDGWPNLEFKLDPSLSILDFEYPLHEIWNEPNFDFETLHVSPTHLAIFRQNSFIFVQSITPPQKAVLRRMQDGWALGEICDELETSTPESDDLPPVMEWFTAWTGNGIIKRCQVRLMDSPRQNSKEIS